MPNEFDLIRSINRRLLGDIAQKRAENVEQLKDLDAKIALIKKNLEQLDYDRSQILAAEKIQENFLQSNSENISINSIEPTQENHTGEYSAENEDADRGKLKARIGDQRYLILACLRGKWLSFDRIVWETGLPAKRVKDALKADADLGVIKESQYRAAGEDRSFYTLSGLGIDLIERFEAYKRQKGQKLPTRAEVLRDIGLGLPDDDVPPPNSLEDYGVTRTLSAEDRDAVSAANDLLESPRE